MVDNPSLNKVFIEEDSNTSRPQLEQNTRKVRWMGLIACMVDALIIVY